MCGLFIEIKNKDFHNFRKKFSSAAQLLSHRGDDKKTFYYDENIRINFFRLKIRDLSRNGRQPMLDHSGRYLIVLSGISRFKIIQEINTEKLYRECKVNFNDFKIDLSEIKQKINFSDLKLIFKKTKSLFNKHGYIINWKDLESKNLNQTINTISMASPFSLEEKQVLLEALNINDRKKKLEEILSTYSVDNISNTTLQ